LFHQTYVARVIADLAISHTGWDRFADLLSNILRDKLGIDLKVIQIQKYRKSLWTEFNRLNKIRNGILHRGQSADQKEANIAISVAEEFGANIFPKLLSNFSLSLDSNGNIKDGTSKVGRPSTARPLVPKILPFGAAIVYVTHRIIT
jgi:hypothetical protein